MGKQIYLIRHCQAAGQDPDAPLTEKGKNVETLSIVKHVTSTKIAELLVDGIRYELAILAPDRVAPTQTGILRKLD